MVSPRTLREGGARAPAAPACAISPLLPTEPDYAPRGHEAGEDVLALRERVAELEARNAALERYARAAAHDLAQPVRGIAQLCTLVREAHGADLPAEASRLLEVAARSSWRLQAMLRDLLDDACGGREGGRAVAARPETPGDEVLTAVLEALAPAAEVAGCRARVAGPLPMVAVGRADLFRLLANLVGNAIRHRVRGLGDDAPPPEVEVGAVAEAGGAGRWRFWVADNGPGVPHGERERAFAPGARGAASPGAGLGLAFCREIVGRHGGRVWVEPSSPARGARFVFTLPAATPVGGDRDGL